MKLTTGLRLASTVCATEVIVVRPLPGDVDLTCGGESMAPFGSPRGVGMPQSGLDTGALLGKRYTDATGSLEILVTKPGVGTLGTGKEPLLLKDSKPLPSSD
jgi:hypothetical protein